MGITITAGGPTGQTEAVSISGLVEAISNDIDDTNGEYTNEIVTALNAAVRYCERNTYYFNEARDVTFTTVAGQEWYDDDDSADITTLIRIQDAYCEQSGAQRRRLNRATPEEIELLADAGASTGEPYAFTYFGRRLRLYPIPDSASYTIRLQVGPYRLNFDATDETSTSAWVTEAYDMIKARAKYILFKDTLLDPARAAEALNDYNDQHRALKGETALRNGSGKIAATAF